ncbi:hypothetical protein [Acidianus sp. HS-5]|uniref:hypothetical protein n=1 Tax=Acidianus sp. HS-5 TaxID=2886040 RepID=UPI001F264162|nr:hypothetical protein [Acidianus sp. HS-5]BDC17751.1 hypothetical protein HS5_06410 [Acidianus sp. HS-5]
MENEIVFVSKVSVSKESKEYITYKITIPIEKAKELGLNDGDFLLVNVKEAKWYHLLNWEEMKVVYNMLPEEIKREIDNLKR